MTSMKRISSLKRISSTCDVKRLMNAPAAKGEQYVPTDVEHLANIFTHGIGVPPSAIGTLFMIYLAKTKLQYFIALLYGLALMTLFSVSCTYHTICYRGIFRKLKETFHFGDRAILI
ncbi:hypothetical protein KUTeg_004309 [Tegillarca granosa]|uniref:Uncharacterized protein n=1 Tax=Tegillarca granosa TaxID=220873 RepID=A0ABQ9FPL3_TEGGR|nr:hypothetical protein KUTeg_004309 [Tegillarca granosa]